MCLIQTKVPVPSPISVPQGIEQYLQLSMEPWRLPRQLSSEKMLPSPRPRILAFLLCLAVHPAGVFAKRVPDPSFKTLDGGSHKLSALRGQIVVVNFWATWCGPCQEELPRLSQIAASYSGKPVSFVFISIDDPKDRAKIPSALAKLHLDFTSWIGADTDTLDGFGLGNIVPGTIVLDETGTPVARVMGEAREDDVRKPIDWLLGNKKGDPPKALTKRL